MALKSNFWRIVRTYPSFTIELEKGFGRSAYLCPQVDCLQLAIKKNRLGRSLKTKINSDIYEKLWQELAKKELLHTDDHKNLQ